MKIRIGHLSTFYHTSTLLLADTVKGFDADWKLFGTGPAIVEAFKKNEIDLAYIGLPPAIIGMDQGVKITCIAGGHMEGTVLSGGKDCKEFSETYPLEAILKQFSGQKIGVPGKGSIHDVIIKECLDRFNLTSAVEVVNFKWADYIIEAMYREEIPAAIGTPALAAAVKRFTGGKVLCPPSLLWKNNPSYGIVVSRAFLKPHRETVEKFLAHHKKATSFLRLSPSDAAKIISKYVGIVDDAFVMDILSISPKYCVSLSDQYVSTTMDFVKVLKRLQYIRRDITCEEIFDKSLIQKIHPEKDHYENSIADT